MKDDVSLRDYFMSQIDNLKGSISGVKEITLMIQEQSKLAQDKFEAGVKAEFVKTNEFRGALEDLGKNMALRREVEAAIISLDNKIHEVNKQLSELRSRMDVGPVFHPTLQSQLDVYGGREKYAKDNWNKTIAIIMATAAVVGTLFHFLKL